MAVQPLLHRVTFPGLPFSLRLRKSDADDDLGTHLERLAHLSPHLLADLGFEPDPRRSSPQCTVWRRDALTVAVESGPPTVRVDHGRAPTPAT